MHVLVTGSAGFLGSHLVDRLQTMGHQVSGLDDSSTGSRFSPDDTREDVRSFRWAQKTFYPNLERIYHLACPASPQHYQKDPAKTIETAFLGTKHAIWLAKETGARLLITSTSEVYGEPLSAPQHETLWSRINILGPRACYDVGKAAAEVLARAYRGEVDVRIARVFNTYGPGLDPGDGRVVSNFIVQALRGDPLTIYGDGRQTRSFCYVSDMIDGLIRLMEYPTVLEDPVNLGNPQETTIEQLAGRIIRACGSTSSYQFQPLPVDDPTQRRPNIERATNVLGWWPVVPIEMGLRVTIQWFQNKLGLEKLSL